VAKRTNYGDGSIHQHHVKGCPKTPRCGCKWRGVMDVGVTERGTRRRVTVTASTEAEARRRLRDRAAERKRAMVTAADTRATVASWGPKWLEIREQTVRPKTFESDRTAVRKYIVPTLGRVRLVDLTPRHMRDLEAAARRAGLPTAIRAHAAMKTMLRDAIAEGHAVPGSILTVARPGKTIVKKARPKREALTLPHTLAVLRQAAQLPDGARWFVALMTGARQGEVLGLEWDRVDLERGLLNISWQLQPLAYCERFDRLSGFRVPHDYEARHLVGRFHLVRPKTVGSERWVPMLPLVQHSLAAWRDVAPPNPHGLVFARSDGWPIDKADDAILWRELQDAAGVKHRTGRYYFGHEARNTAATFIGAGGDPAALMALLGHNSYATTQGYITAREDAMRAALGNLERALGELES
jgi:integrase